MRVRRTGFPHSDIAGYCVCTRLASAYRSVPRPSSALDAKAFPVCPYLLGTTDTEKRMLSHGLRVCFCLCLRYVVVKVPARPLAVERENLAVLAARGEPRALVEDGSSRRRPQASRLRPPTD